MGPQNLGFAFQKCRDEIGLRQVEEGFSSILFYFSKVKHAEAGGAKL